MPPGETIAAEDNVQGAPDANLVREMLQVAAQKLIEIDVDSAARPTVSRPPNWHPQPTHRRNALV